MVTFPFGLTLRVGVGFGLMLGEEGDVGDRVPAPVVAGVTPTLALVGNSLVRPTIPRTTKITRMSPRSVDVATARRTLPSVGGPCCPAPSAAPLYPSSPNRRANRLRRRDSRSRRSRWTSMGSYSSASGRSMSRLSS